METRKIFTVLVIASGLLVCLPKVGNSEPMGTAFTYQGRLMDANGPADGLYDFEFKLYDAVEDGNQLDGTVDINDLAVYDGYFTVLLDFGSSVFNGDARWLEICVQPGDSEGRCTTLSPRQEVTATPYALQTRGMFVDDVLNVGIGTTSPVGKLHVDGGKAMDGTVGADVVLKAQNGGDGWAMQNDGEAGGDVILLPGEGGEGYGGGSPGPAGNVGIGTTSPEAKLGIASPSSGAALGVGRASGEPSIIASSDAHGGWLIMDSTGSGKTGLNYYIDGDVILVNGGGNVGIGIASPAYPLHVKKNSANTWIAGLHNLGTGPQDNGLVVRADGGDPLLVQAGSLNALNVKQNGNIGIGTTSPTSKLQVNGKIHASNMPGCEYSDFSDYSNVPGGWNNVGSISLTLPEAGYIIVTFTGTTFIDDPGIATICIGVTPTSNEKCTMISNNSSDEYIPFCVQYTTYFNGVGGTVTFYGNVTSSVVTNLENMQMTAIYVPVRY